MKRDGKSRLFFAPFVALKRATESPLPVRVGGILLLSLPHEKGGSFMSNIQIAVSAADA